MSSDNYVIEPMMPFSESGIWNLNKSFYRENSIGAWTNELVPHNIASNAVVAESYAKLVLDFLRDLADQGNVSETVYILELGAGHGRLGFQILRQLDKQVSLLKEKLPPYCYILSDIVVDTISFYSEHHQFQEYFDRGILDIAYFDATETKELQLQKSEKKICPSDLSTPLFTIANYFFDSIPNDLFYVKDKEISFCSVALSSKQDPKEMDADMLIRNLELSYEMKKVEYPFYKNGSFNKILEGYKNIKAETYIFFPRIGMDCLTNLKALSKAGLILLTMDKGYHELDALVGKKIPDMVTHGSFSFLVNFHALATFCLLEKGKVLFPTLSNLNVDVGCLIFGANGLEYTNLEQGYHRNMDRFGPDDYNCIKQLAYFNVARMKLGELISMYRLSSYDSDMFIKFLPRLKQLMQSITMQERKSLGQAIKQVWEMHFEITESYDLSYELGGILYDLAFYTEALNYFEHSEKFHGVKIDVYYNKVLCYYQLRKDFLFYKTLTQAQESFPDSELLQSLDKLDMGK